MEPDSKDPVSKDLKNMVPLGVFLGYLLFAGFLYIYQQITLKHFDSTDFAWRLFTPFIIIKFQWTDLVCYGLMVVSFFLVSRLPD